MSVRVSGIVAAVFGAGLLSSSAMASVSWSYFGGGDAGFNALTNNGSLERAVAEGRIGNNALSGTWERAIWQQGGVGGTKAEGQFVWGNGSAYAWSFNWDGVNTVTFNLADTSISWNQVAGDFTDIFIRTRSGNDSSLLLSELAFSGVDGNLNPGNLFSTGNGDVNYLQITNGGSPLGAFSLGGLVQFDWTGNPPTNSALAFQVKFTNVIPAPASMALLGLAGVLRRRRRG